jgi:hypothetical protein
MTFDEFHNGIRILLNLDMSHLVVGGVIAPDDHTAWAEFRSNPHLYFIRSGDERAGRLWALMQQRMTPRQAAI